MSVLRVAIVGAGPAGFYAADKLLRSDLAVEIALLDRLPTPWGLVRAGVAPDHPNIKAVSRVFEKTAALPGFAFFGNVEVGADISHEDLMAHHHAVMYCFGSAADRTLGIPGENLPGSASATEFVAWYNGHPDFCDAQFDLDVERVVVVGNGNVALDVARMLVLTRAELAATDVADHALDALADSAVREVVVLGRRGPVQAAYTTPELRELGELTDADVIVDPRDVVLDAASTAALESASPRATVRRNVEVVTGYAGLEPAGRRRRVVLRYLVSPLELIGRDRVEAVRVVRNELVDEGGRLVARATGVEELIDAGLVLRSVGYRGTPIAGIPFDERSATIANDGGRVIDPATGAPLVGVYTAGWIKRGPSGVIGTNKKCANETVALLLADAAERRLPAPAGDGDDFAALLAERAALTVDYAGWERIDAHERGAGEPQGRPRVKLVRPGDLLDQAGVTSRG